MVMLFPDRFATRLCFAAVILTMGLSGLASATPVRPSALDKEAPYRRFIWVTRWDFSNAADIQRICYNAASARFTDIIFQVRGEGTVFFKSPYEPWAGELSTGNSERGIGSDPGWDPLAVAVKEAHKAGLRIHAWVNVMPGWNHRSAPPASANQLYTRRSGWFMVDAAGHQVQAKGFYACLEPALPEVQDYLAFLFGKMAQDYAVDGVHLDYIRYPVHEETGCDYSFHPRAAEVFRKTYSRDPRELPDTAQKFRRQQISTVVRKITQAVRKARPGTEMSASVIANPEKGFCRAGQDPQGWLDERIIDAVAPMVYVRGDLSEFVAQTQPYFTTKYRNGVWVGIWPRKENPNFLDQIRIAAQNQPAGVAIFCYADLFPNHKAAAQTVNIYKTFVSSARPANENVPGSQIASAPAKPATKAAPRPSAPASKPARQLAVKQTKKPKTAMAANLNKRQLAEKHADKRADRASKRKF